MLCPALVTAEETRLQARPLSAVSDRDGANSRRAGLQAASPEVRILGGERRHAGRSNCCVGSTGLLGRQFAFASYWARVDGTAPRWRGTRSDSSLPIGLEVDKPRRSALYTESFIGPFGGKANDSPCERSETAGQRATRRWPCAGCTASVFGQRHQTQHHKPKAAQAHTGPPHGARARGAAARCLRRTRSALPDAAPTPCRRSTQTPRRTRSGRSARPARGLLRDGGRAGPRATPARRNAAKCLPKTDVAATSSGETTF